MTGCGDSNAIEGAIYLVQEVFYTELYGGFVFKKLVLDGDTCNMNGAGKVELVIDGK